MCPLVDGFVAAKALGERFEDAGLYGWKVVHQLVELTMADHEQPRWAHGARGRGARLPVDQRDLSQEVTLAERRDDRSVDVDLHGTVEHDKELRAGLALAGQHPAVRDIHLICER